MTQPFSINPALDLLLEKTAKIAPEKVWRALTEPHILMQWFCPLPWKTVECRIDLRPGGEFSTVMQSPEGERFPNTGCFLEVIPEKKITWTGALLPNFRPVFQPENGVDMLFTAHIWIAPHQDGTKYTVIVMHKDQKDCETHKKMGFHEGWGKAFDQLVAMK